MDPSPDSVWGSPYPENCHGIPAFKNIVDDPAERQRIASLHDGGLPGPDIFGLTVPFNGALAYQCVEFVSRYYREALGHGDLGGGHAKTFLQGTRGGLEVHRFPTPVRPQAGDLLVEEAGPSPVGHVGIVKSAHGDPGGPLRVEVIQQNRGRSSALTEFTVTPTQQDQTIGGVTRSTTVYAQDGDWAGFRRKPGMKPHDDLGGYSNNKGLGKPDMGGGNYVVQAGQTVSLSDVASMYGLTVDLLLAYNPGISTSVTAPADHSIEILVTDSFRPSEQTIGTVQTTRRGILRGGPGTSHAQVGMLPQDATVWVYEVVSGEQVIIETPATETEPSQTRRSQDWYRIATFTGAAAYVSAALCTELGGQGTRGGR